jgi:hypothetical protein
MPQELQVLTNTTIELSRIFEMLSIEVQALKDMDDIESHIKSGAEMLVQQLYNKRELLENFTLEHTIRCCLIEGIQMFDEILVTRARDE